MSGALWGDVAPWWMKSVDDKIFSYSDSFTNFKMEFLLEGEGVVIEMVHNLNFIKSPLKKLGPLPEDWEPCLERPQR